MLIALLPSEIARLILNYLEEEKYSNTYESFLNECRYLEECKLYLKQGISLPKTIHGKRLGDYLILESEPDKQVKKPTCTKSTQTDAAETADTSKIASSYKDEVENRLEIDFSSDTTDSTDNQPSPAINEPSPAITPPPQIDSALSSEVPIRVSPRQEKYKAEGIQCLVELITSNELNVDLGTETSPVPKIKLIKSPEKLPTKSPEIKLYKSPEKKIRLEIKPEIITLSSDDSDDEMPINFNASKKRKLLIGKNAEKVPELSVSSLERQLNLIVNDATNHIKLQEEQERLQQQQNQIFQNSSFDILNTINKGPPLVDFQVPSVPTQLNQLGNHQVIGQLAPLNQVTQLKPINSITQLNSIGQIGQIAQIAPLGQMGQIAQISLPQQMTLPNIPGFAQPQQVIFVSNPNDLNLNFQAAKPVEQQIIRLPQLANLNGINVATVNDLNTLKKALSNSVRIPSKQAPILANALKTCEKMIAAQTGVPINASTMVNSQPKIAIKPANGESVKRVEEKQDLKKDKKSHPRQTFTIKSIFELQSNSVVPTACETPYNNTNNMLIVDGNSNSSCNSSIADVTSTTHIQLSASASTNQLEFSAVDTQPKLSESRNDDEHVSDDLLGLLGIKVPEVNKEASSSSNKEDSMATDFDLDCIVKKSDSPAKKTPKKDAQNNLQRRKSSRLEAKLNDEIESMFNEAPTSNANNANSSCSRTLRSRTNSQRKMI